MTVSAIPLCNELHRAYKLSALADFSHAQHEHLVPVALGEYCQLASDYPVVFVKNSQTGQFQAVALTGLIAGDNLYCHQNTWRAAQLPQWLKLYPFAMVVQDNQLRLAIVNNCPLLNQSEGLAFYLADGQEAPLLQQRRAQWLQHLQQTQLMRAWVQRLATADVLEAKVLQLADGQEINGLYLVSEHKLQNLSPEQHQAFHLAGDAQYINAHFKSLANIQRLVQWYTDRSAGSV